MSVRMRVLYPLMILVDGQYMLVYMFFFLRSYICSYVLICQKFAMQFLRFLCISWARALQCCFMFRYVSYVS